MWWGLEPVWFHDPEPPPTISITWPVELHELPPSPHPPGSSHQGYLITSWQPSLTGGACAQPHNELNSSLLCSDYQDRRICGLGRAGPLVVQPGAWNSLPLPSSLPAECQHGNCANSKAFLVPGFLSLSGPFCCVTLGHSLCFFEPLLHQLQKRDDVGAPPTQRQDKVL